MAHMVYRSRVRRPVELSLIHMRYHIYIYIYIYMYNYNMHINILTPKRDCETHPNLLGLTSGQSRLKDFGLVTYFETFAQIDFPKFELRLKAVQLSINVLTRRFL